eukprot:jgi/Psemu1/46478/gm1.46478_g
MARIDQEMREGLAQVEIVDPDRGHHDRGAEADRHHHHRPIACAAARDPVPQRQRNHEFGQKRQPENQRHIAALDFLVAHSHSLLPSLRKQHAIPDRAHQKERQRAQQHRQPVDFGHIPSSPCLSMRRKLA